MHADNSRAPCGKEGMHCVKEWHHNWVHDCQVAAGETLILLHQPSPFSKRFNADGEGVSAN